MECQFCHSVLATEWNLKTHQKTAKYCLRLQTNSVSNSILNSSRIN